MAAVLAAHELGEGAGVAVAKEHVAGSHSADAAAVARFVHFQYTRWLPEDD